MASSSTYAFFQSAVEVPHCSLQHPSWNTTNFVLDSSFQFIQCPWSSRVDPILKVAPQGNNHKQTNPLILGARECHRILRRTWLPNNSRKAATDCLAVCDVAPSCWKPGFVKLWKIVQCRCNKRLQHLNIRISKVPVFLCHLVHVRVKRTPKLIKIAMCNTYIIAYHINLTPNMATVLSTHPHLHYVPDLYSRCGDLFSEQVTISLPITALKCKF